MCNEKEDKKNMNNFVEFVAKNKDKIRKVAEANTTRNINGVAVLAKNDSWRQEIEWEKIYKELMDKQ